MSQILSWQTLSVNHPSQAHAYSDHLRQHVNTGCTEELMPDQDVSAHPIIQELSRSLIGVCFICSVPLQLSNSMRPAEQIAAVS